MFTAFTPRSASAYQRINVETSMHTMDQHQLVSLLLDGLLQAVATARGALARGDVQTKCGSITKALRILEEGLMTALDREAGGEVAANLEAVYDYALRRLIQANARNDDTMLQEVSRLIEPIVQAWKEMKNNSHEASQIAQLVPAEA
ncbi:flagellar export chaperone FliS [Diaphorobacter nitroreducens]|uniref:flagellar export chaperone FliS n=1 Tax=Diaphorobacter nitroreducens TaxID=164759 RepID=UPI0035AFBB65